MATEQKQRKPLRISTEEYDDFKAIKEESYWKTSKLAKRINKLFGSVFEDFYGSTIFINPMPGNVTPTSPIMSIELYFKPLPAGAVDESRFRAFRAIDESKEDNSILAGLQKIRSSQNNIKFEVTEEGCEILSEFTIDGLNINPFKPGSFKGSFAEFNDQNIIYVKLVNLDLTKILKKVFGPTMSCGEKADYSIIPMRPVNMMQTEQQLASNPYMDWYIDIVKASVSGVNDLATELGVFNVGKSPIITGV